MKKIYNYAFKMVCVYVVVLTVFSIFNMEITKENYYIDIKNSNQDKLVESSLLASMKDVITTNDKEESINTTKNDEVFVEGQKQEIEEKKEEPSTKPVIENVNIIDTSSYPVISQETINLSHYGHDCYGCTSGYTASGYYVGDGRIYYNDNTFGSVRVVAADRKYPLGTILRIGYHGSKITAIVLDRGGAINDSSRFQIDLLTSSNSEAYQLGIVEQTSLEVLRLGY